MIHTPRMVLVLALALGAAFGCGGKPPATTTTDTTPPPSGGRMAGPGTVVGDAALYATVKASTIALPAGPADMQCAGDQPTLGEQVAAWEQQLGGPIGARCDAKHCTIELSTAIDPSCDTNRDQDGCDGSSQVIEVDIDDAGEIVVASLMCMAAG